MLADLRISVFATKAGTLNEPAVKPVFRRELTHVELDDFDISKVKYALDILFSVIHPIIQIDFL